MELSALKAALRRGWLLVVLITCAAAAIAAVVTATQPKMYTATAQGVVSVSNSAGRPPYALSSGAQYILDRMTSYANLGVTTPVLTPVIDDLGLPETPGSLADHVSSHSVVGKALLEVSVTYKDPRTAAAIADSVLAEIGKAVTGLEQGNVTVTAVGAALPPTSPSNGKVVVTTAVAGAGGLVLGSFVAVGLALFRARRRRTPAAVSDRSADG